MPITTNRATLRSDEHATTHDAVAPHIWPHLPNITLGLLRVVSGLMFMQHGLQKHFGFPASPDMPFRGAPEILSQVWWAGTLEVVGGALLVLGLFTRVVGFILSGEMAFAYFMVHAKRALFPVLNGGELAALYCFVFLAFAGMGGGRFSLDHLLHARRSVSSGASASTRRPRSRADRNRPSVHPG